MIRFGWSSSATPTGDIPTATSASTKEYSRATTRVGVPVIVVVPRSCFTVRVALPHWSRFTSGLTPSAAAARSAFGAAPVADVEAEPPQPDRATAAAVRVTATAKRRNLEVRWDMAFAPDVDNALQGWDSPGRDAGQGRVVDVRAVGQTGAVVEVPGSLLVAVGAGQAGSQPVGASGQIDQAGH